MKNKYGLYAVAALFVGVLYISYTVEKKKQENDILGINKLVELNKQLDVILEDLSDKRRVMGTA